MSGQPAWKPQRSTWTRTAGQAAVRARSPRWCELRIPGVCLGRGASFSHRRPASLGGGYDPSGGLRACGSGTTGCHGWVEHHPAEAELRGWRVTVGATTETPAYIWAAHAAAADWWLLTDNNPSLYVLDGALEAALSLGLPARPHPFTT